VICVKYKKTKTEYALRVHSPKKFDKRSFRTKNVIPGKMNIIVGCPKGKYDAKRGKCKVGTKIQAFRLKQSAYSPQYALGFAKRHKRDFK